MDTFKTVDFEGLDPMSPTLDPIYSSQTSMVQFKVDYLPDDDYNLEDGLLSNYSIMSLVEEESEFSKSLLGLRKTVESHSAAHKDPLAIHDIPPRLNGGINHARPTEGLLTRAQLREREDPGLEKLKPVKDPILIPPTKILRGATKELKRPTRNHLNNHRQSPPSFKRRPSTSPLRGEEQNGKNSPAQVTSKRLSRSKKNDPEPNRAGREGREKRLSSLRSSAGFSSGRPESFRPITVNSRKPSISPKPAEVKLVTKRRQASEVRKDLRIDSHSVKSLARPKLDGSPPEKKTLQVSPESPPCLSLVEPPKEKERNKPNGKLEEDSDSDSFPSLNESSADVSLEGNFREPHSSVNHDSKKKKRGPGTIYAHITILQGDPQMYQCNVCMKKFKTKAHIKYHEFCQNANGEKLFKCEQCGQGFIAKSHYEYHLRTHTGESPYVCPKCGKGFNQRGKVTRHMRSHTGEKPFVCQDQECGRGFANAQALRSHFFIHTGERPFACQYCNKRFTGMTNLKKHVITHTGERPFICTHCGKSFGLKWTLNFHLRTHSSERPYTCDQCSRAFSNSKDLRRHLVIHSGERPFKCWLCGTSFRRKDNLDRHIKNAHNQTKEIAKHLANEAAAEYLAETKSRPNSLIKPPVSEDEDPLLIKSEKAKAIEELSPNSLDEKMEKVEDEEDEEVESDDGGDDMLRLNYLTTLQVNVTKVENKKEDQIVEQIPHLTYLNSINEDEKETLGGT